MAWFRKIANSDNWGMFFADMGGHLSMTSFDDGLSAHIDKVKLPNGVKICTFLTDTREDGMPSSAEGERLIELGPCLEDAIEKAGGLYLGRVTSNGERWDLALAPRKTEKLQASIAETMQSHGFKHEIYVELDPEKDIYWKDLYPDADSRQVMNDMDVLRALDENGDVHEVERRVDHWGLLKTQASAERFASWLSENGYELSEITQTEEGKGQWPWVVRFAHEGTMQLGDITHHTIKLNRSLREHDGVYDGWETLVVKQDEQS